MLEQVKQEVEAIKADLIQLSEFILEHPELGNQEFKACSAHLDLLKKYGFTGQAGYLGRETAFRAEYANEEKFGPTVCYMAEYDALPEIGHGCGHNILGAVSTGAGIALRKFIDQVGGKVVVLGTPAEESFGAKVEFAEKGAFADIDVAMMAHPSDGYYKSGPSLAMKAIQFTYHGKTAHAAASPEKGINALDAAINTFNNINALREHIRSDARVHGIISEGGQAANVVPELAQARFYIRATSKAYLEELEEKVLNCARGASLAAGTEMEHDYYEPSFYNMLTNEKLSQRLTHNLKELGVEKIKASESSGSLDAGNVSHVCPTIHAYFPITTEEVTGHTVEFRDKTKTAYAYQEMARTVTALTQTGIDVIQNADLLAEIKQEFASKTGHK
ncbi:MAG: M20 family metallopeptidase [Bacillota bacterium]